VQGTGWSLYRQDPSEKFSSGTQNTRSTQSFQILDLVLCELRVLCVLRIRYAQLKPDFASGSDRTRFPEAAEIALVRAPMAGGNAGSPSPVT
jgi:hypothetical protein